MRVSALDGLALNPAACFLTIQTFRSFLMALVQQPDPAYLAVNAVPGLVIAPGGVISNIDDVIPDIPDIASNVHAFQTVAQRVFLVVWPDIGRS